MISSGAKGNIARTAIVRHFVVALPLEQLTGLVYQILLHVTEFTYCASCVCKTYLFMFVLPWIICACMLYYCNMVQWAWWDWELSRWLTTLLQCFDTSRRPYNLYCVGADVKPCSVSRLWHQTCKNTVHKMTYIMSSGTLQPNYSTRLPINSEFI